MRLLPRILAGLGGLVAALAAAGPARADASAWMFAGTGAVGWKNASATQSNGVLAFDVGVGTTPDASFILGGLFRFMPILGHGTDLALMARGATHAFQSGGFGLAVDAGGYERFWGTKSAGFAGQVTLGAPLGLQLSGLVTVGTNDAFEIGAVAGIDVLRLTVYRQTLLDWWTNPSPAQHLARTAVVPRSF